jgi:tetratricopeptide (TPR) repeat protein
MRLDALDDSDTRHLAGAASTGRLAHRDLERLVGRSGGNPLFLANLVDAASASGQVESLPSTIESLITQRIDHLDGRDRVLLREAAVAGMDLDLPLLTRVLGAHVVGRSEAWRRLSPFLARMGPGRLRFQHGLYQRVAYEGLSFRRRREIHLALGNALEQDRAEPAVLSLHFWRARDDTRAYRWSRTAAVGAQRAYANAEAVELYQRALACAPRAGVSEPDIAELAEALGDVLELTADYDGAGVAYSEARQAAGTALARTTARLHRKVGELRERTGGYPDALRWYRRALRVLDGDGSVPADRAELAEVELAYAGTRYRQGKALEAREWAVRAVGHATEAGDDRALGHAYYLLTIIDVALGDTSPPSGGVALDLLAREGDLVQQAKLYNNLGIAAYFAGDWDAALAQYERCRDLARRAGDLVLEATVVSNIGEILSDRGQLTEAIELFEEAREAFARAKYSIGVALTTGNLGRATLRGGDADEASRLLADARRKFESIHAGSFVAETLVRLAECAIGAGDPDGALAFVGHAEQGLRITPDSFVAVGAARVRAEALLAAGRLTEAAMSADESVRMARQAGALFEQARSLEVRASVARALAAAAATDGDEAAELLARLGVRQRTSAAQPR